MEDFLTRPPKTLYFTAEALEYSRKSWPDSYEMVGPATWGPKSEAPDWLSDIRGSIVLVTCSTETQGDAAMLEAALLGMKDTHRFVVGTSAAHDPDSFEIPANARVERFLPHDPIIERASVVVCHGGMGITQRALAKGVPVVVVPFGRDQLEVARRVERAEAGVRLLPGKLNPARLRAAVASAEALRPGAKRIAQAFRNTGGAERAADVVESLLGSSAHAEQQRRASA
jgi:MGT family glycosyltransferase